VKFIPTGEVGHHPITTASYVRDGDAVTTLIEEATRWGADSVFVGAKRHGVVGQVLLGSVSAAVAERAPCSVEVVR
jgi:nucleotide-binding universal stress UspA family protein